MSRPETSHAAPPDSAPRFALGWATLAYALATLALAYPMLSTGGMLAAGVLLDRGRERLV